MTKSKNTQVSGLYIYHDYTYSHSELRNSAHEGIGTNQSEGARAHQLPVGVFTDVKTKHGKCSRKTVGGGGGGGQQAMEDRKAKLNITHHDSDSHGETCDPAHEGLVSHGIVCVLKQS